jgi:hypothetical protein
MSIKEASKNITKEIYSGIRMFWTDFLPYIDMQSQLLQIAVSMNKHVWTMWLTRVRHRY